MLPIVLLTRPLADLRGFAARLGDVPVVISPILRIVPVDHDAAAAAAAPALVFTSRHAVAFGGPGRGRVAYCVGAGTAAMARKAGFRVIEGPGDAAGLIPLLRSADLPLLHLRGRYLARDLDVPGMVVYDQQPQALSEQAMAVLAGDRPVLLPLFSPRSARLVSRAAAGARAPLQAVAISAAVAAAWDGPRADMEIAAHPDADLMLAAINQLLLRERS